LDNLYNAYEEDADNVIQRMDKGEGFALYQAEHERVEELQYARDDYEKVVEVLGTDGEDDDEDDCKISLMML
jgi:hypothetical protein